MISQYSFLKSFASLYWKEQGGADLMIVDL